MNPADNGRLAKFWSRGAQSFDRRYEYSSRLARWRSQSIELRSEEALRCVRGLEQPTLLDVGCGSGRQVVAAKRSGARRAFGVDLAPEMVSLARDHAARAGLAPRADWWVGDALSFTSAERFDVVWALGVFDYVREPLPLLRHMAELAETRVIATFRRIWAVRSPLRWMMYRARGCPIYLYTRGQLEELAKAAGLEQVTLRCPNATFYHLEARPLR